MVGLTDGSVDGAVDGDMLGLAVGDGVGQLIVVGNALVPIVLLVGPLQLMQVKGHPLKALAPE